jgi:hypothetical protein
MEGGCTCRQLRYRLNGAPLIVHACHCRWCQRETGTAFALNALYEADRVTHLGGAPDIVLTPSLSGKGQRIARCPSCRVGIWSNYPQAGPAVRFVRVGTLDEPDRLPPDIHIFTSSKQRWLTLPPTAKMVAEFYDLASTWSRESLERRRLMQEKVKSDGRARTAVAGARPLTLTLVLPAAISASARTWPRSSAIRPRRSWG